MTEDEWLGAGSVDPLLKWLQRSKRHRPSVRKMQLLANALADRVSELLADETSRGICQFMDRLADSALTSDQYRVEWGAWRARVDAALRADVPIHILSWAVYVSAPDGGRVFGVPETCVRSVAGYVCRELGDTERVSQVRLLRDIVRNPFRPVSFNPAWRTDTAVAVARQMYDSRDFGAMPILADALQDAGCEDEQVLMHCREPGPHVRGCWVCDAVLGFA